MGTGFAKKKKDARQLREQISSLQHTLSSKLEVLEAEGKAGNGLVTVLLAGTGEMKQIHINPECVDPEDVGGLEALIKAAHTDAFKKIQEVAESTPSFETLFPPSFG